MISVQKNWNSEKVGEVVPYEFNYPWLKVGSVAIFVKLLGLESDSTTEALLFYRFTSSGETSFVLDVLQRRYQVFFEIRPSLEWV